MGFFTYNLISANYGANLVRLVKNLLVLIPLLVMLTGCDQIMQMLNKQQANGKAIGASCRLSGRSLEDCYRRNTKTAKADIFAGWKEMNEYMQAKKLEEIPPPPDVKTGSLSPIAELDASAAASASEASAADAAPKKH